MTYRPTVRYDEIFRDYINDLFHATTLDRNQILRAALFSAAYSKEFANLIAPYLKKSSSFPLPKWSPDQHGYWKKHEYNHIGGECVNAIDTGSRRAAESIRTTESSEGTVARRERAIHSGEQIRISNEGSISFTL